MIQVISGSVPSLLKNELLRWKNWFISKHGEIWVNHIIWANFELQDLRNILYSRSFFSEKKLLILEDFPLTFDLIDELLGIFDWKDDDTVVLIVLHTPDKRLSSYKKLCKIASEYKDYSIIDNATALSFLHKNYGNNFQSGAIDYLFEIKWYKFEKTVGEIIKLLDVYDFITLDTIREFIVPELDSSIFHLIDMLLQKHPKWFFSEIELLLSKENFYLISQALISNLRNNLYIEYLKSKVPHKQISDILNLWKKSFLVTKKHNTSYREISELYMHLIEFDSRMKQGKLWVSAEDDVKQYYKTVFLGYFSKPGSLS